MECNFFCNESKTESGISNGIPENGVAVEDEERLNFNDFQSTLKCSMKDGPPIIFDETRSDSQTLYSNNSSSSKHTYLILTIPL